MDAWWGQPPGQLMELDLSLPQAPAEMTQLPVIKAEPQEVNQFLKVTPGESVSREGPFPSSLRQTASLLPWSSTPNSLHNPTSLRNILPHCLPTLHPYGQYPLALLANPRSFTNRRPICCHSLTYPSLRPSVHPPINLGILCYPGGFPCS